MSIYHIVPSTIVPNLFVKATIVLIPSLIVAQKNIVVLVYIDFRNQATEHSVCLVQNKQHNNLIKM